MCLAMPGKIGTIEDGRADVDFGGISRSIALDLIPDLKTGDYILAHAGFAIQRLDPEEVEELKSLLKDIEESSDWEQGI